MTATLDLNLALPASSLERYIHSVNLIPMLTAEEERDYAERYRDHNDLQAARMLVLAHLRFVVKVARGYSGYGLQHADLIQEGNIGLMKAVKRFSPEIGVRLVSFAVHWIRAEIHEFILRNWRIVKVATTKAQRKLFFNLRNSKKRLGWFNQEEINQVAADLGVNPKTVLEMEQRLNAHDSSFDPYSEVDEDSQSISPAAYLQDMRFEPQQLNQSLQTEATQTEGLQQAISQLDERSREIIARRWLAEDKATLHELASQFNVSAERIRQLEESALKKLRKSLTDYIN